MMEVLKGEKVGGADGLKYRWAKSTDQLQRGGARLNATSNRRNSGAASNSTITSTPQKNTILFTANQKLDLTQGEDPQPLPLVEMERGHSAQATLNLADNAMARGAGANPALGLGLGRHVDDANHQPSGCHGG